MSSAVNPLSSSSTAATGSAGQTTPSTDPLASEGTFLTLLVSQLQNQDPLDPTDSNQFVSQLTAYSQLEQLININANTTPVTTPPTGTTPPTTTGTNSTTGTGN